MTSPMLITGLRSAFEQRFRNWLLSDYHHRRHSEITFTPASRWEKGGYVSRMPESLEQLDLLLLTVRKTRRVQQDGIRFEGYRYIDATLASYMTPPPVPETMMPKGADPGQLHQAGSLPEGRRKERTVLS